MRNLLLVSSSRLHGFEFLDHCIEAITNHFSESKSLLFVPYALADHDGYTKLVSDRLAKVGIEVQSIHSFNDPVEAVNNAEGMFIGGGNSFRLLKTLYDKALIQPIRDFVSQGKPYMGSSAGTNMSCPTIRTTNDMPIVQPPSFDALNLIPFQINPHFIDADPNSTHKGETREQRLAEFLEENDIPVAGIREGTWLKITEDRCELCGTTGMMLFQRGKAPQAFDSGADLSFLL